MNLPLTKGFYMCIGLNIDIYMDYYYRCISTKGLLQNLEQTESNSLGGSFISIRVGLGGFLLANLRSAKHKGAAQHNPHVWPNCIRGITVYKSKIHI